MRILKGSGRWSLTAAIVVTWTLSVSTGFSAGGIFDDDWTPPAPPVVSPGDPSPPKPAPPPPVIPADPALPPPTTPARNPDESAPTPRPAVVVAQRQPVPPKQDQARSRALLKQAFTVQLADRSLAARRKLSEELTAEAAKASDIPSDQFVLLISAMKAAEEASNLPLCSNAARLLGDAYEVDATAAEADAAAKMNLKAANAADTDANIRAGIKLLDKLLKADDLVRASRLATVLKALPATDLKLRTSLLDRKKDLDSRRAAQLRFSEGSTTLKQSPGDPTANGDVGSYLCFHKNQWERGLAMLAQGSDAALKSAAKQELANPADTKAQLDMAAAWSAEADKLHADTIAFRACKARAAMWYRRCLPRLTGLEQRKIHSRLAEAVAQTMASPPVVEKVANELMTKDASARFALTDKSLPDEFAVTQSAGEFHISGTKQADVADARGRRCGHLGKIILFGDEARFGSLTVTTVGESEHIKYYIALIGQNSDAFQEMLLPSGIYTWDLVTRDQTVTLTVRDGDRQVSSIETPASQFQSVGLGLTARAPGDKVDFVIELQ